MLRKCLCSLLLGLTGLSVQGQIAFWQYYLGGSAYDKGHSLLHQTDGTLVIGGETRSVNGLGRGNHSSQYDLVLFKYSTQGKRFWKAILGGSDNEYLGQMINTADGGFLVVGTSHSADGDLTSNAGDGDVWIIKLDSRGRTAWTRVLGGRGDDLGTAALQLQNGDYLIGGESASIDIAKTSGIRHHGGLDGYLARLSPEGDLRWERLLGSPGNEQVRRLHELPDGNLLVISSSDGRGDDVAMHLGRKDVWITRLAPNGQEIQWQMNYGGSDNDDVHASAIDTDGNIVLGGTTFSANGHVPKQQGEGDCWLFKITPSGAILWSHTYGGRRPEGINDLTLTEDGGIAFCGMTQSRTGEGDIVLNHGYWDGWLVKVDSMGNMLWSRTAGYEGKDVLNSLAQVPNGGLVTLGYAEQPVNGITLPGHSGQADFWLANFDNLSRKGVRPFVTPPVLLGKVLDRETERPLTATITLTDNNTLDSLSSAETDAEDGSFVLLLPAYGLVSINILAKDYMFFGQDIRMDTVSDQTSTEQVYQLEKITLGASLVLKNIYFETGKWDLLKPSFAEMERVVAFLTLNPRLWIEISGHTDNTGNVDEKKELSLNRASAVRQYLISRGIHDYRLKVKGYGMARPIASNRSPEGRRRNRRVEFEVIKK
jgi:outer membrane protein OmpA-like peptidoglycan-associated protein